MKESERKKENKNIAFLLGAGVSIPAGMPSTQDLTDEILCKWYKWYKDGDQYRLKANSGQSKLYFDLIDKGYTRKIAFFLNLIKNEIDHYYGFIAKVDTLVSYEEIYDLVYHIHQALTRNNDDPLTNRIIHNLVHSIEPICECNQDKYRELELLCTKSLSFIKYVIYIKLSKSYSYLNYLRIIDELNKKGCLKSIFTLNHDTIIESYLRKNLVEYYDGFSEQKEGVRFWEAEFQKNKDKLQILKLHGSIDWYNFKLDDGTYKYYYNVGKIDDELQSVDNSIIIGGIEFSVDQLPLFLTGTNVKYLEYNYGLYLELLYQFHRLLKQTDTLIIADYGFGDNAINLRIIDWMNDKKHKLIIITPNFNNTQKYAKGAMYARLQDWKRDRRIGIIENKIECVSIEDLEPLI